MIVLIAAYALGACTVFGIGAVYARRSTARAAAGGKTRAQRLEDAVTAARTHLDHIADRGKEDPMSSKIARAGLRRIKRTLEGAG